MSTPLSQHQIMVNSTLWDKPEKWMKISSSKEDALGYDQINYIRQRIREYARSKIAVKRINDLTPFARRVSSNENFRIIWKIVVVTVGAITYGAAIRILASSWGEFAIPAALVGGALASFLVDSLATKSLANYYISRQTLNTIRVLGQLWQQQSGIGNSFSKQFFEEQRTLVHEIEGSASIEQIPVNATIALCLSIVEYVAASWLFVNFVSADDLPATMTRSIAATLPVLLTWASSILQAQKFELPEHARALGDKYWDYIVPSPNLGDAELTDFMAEKCYQDARLDVALQIILSDVSNPECPTPEIAQFAFDVEYCKDRKRTLQEVQNRHIAELRKRCEHEVQRLEQAEPQVDQRRLGPAQIARVRARVEADHQVFRARELQRLEDTFQREQDRVMANYSGEIEYWNTKVDEANTRLAEALNAWNH